MRLYKPLFDQSVGRSVGHKTVLKAFNAFFMSLNGSNESLWINNHFKCFFEKGCLSVCMTFFESADARDLGLMTLVFFYSRGNPHCSTAQSKYHKSSEILHISNLKVSEEARGKLNR